MTINELQKTLNYAKRHHKGANFSYARMDAFDTPEINFVVVEVWVDGKVEIYLTDNDEKFVDNHCIYDDTNDYFRGLKHIKVYYCVCDTIYTHKSVF